MLRTAKRQKMEENIMTENFDGDARGDDDRWGTMLPVVVLSKILKYIVDLQGPLPFLSSITRVNKFWRLVSFESVLWTKLDLSSNFIRIDDAVLRYLLDGEKLSQLKEINLSAWNSNLQQSTFMMLADRCTNITTINLHGATNLTSAILLKLVSKCSELVSFDLTSVPDEAVSWTTFRDVLAMRANNLKSLKLANNTLNNFQNVLTFISENSHQMEVLDLSNTKMGNVALSIEQLQNGCPRLKVLRVEGSDMQFKQSTAQEWASSPGFPDLQEFGFSGVWCCVDSSYQAMTNENIILRFLKSSSRLKVLDLSSCDVSGSVLQKLPATNLERLYLSGCMNSVGKYEGISTVLHKWHHSLIEWDLSSTLYPAMSLSMAFPRLNINRSKTKLETLNLGGNRVTWDSLRAVFDGFPQLIRLNLKLCANLPEEFGRDYTGTDLDQLRNSISSNHEDPWKNFPTYWL